MEDSASPPDLAADASPQGGRDQRVIPIVKRFIFVGLLTRFDDSLTGICGCVRLCCGLKEVLYMFDRGEKLIFLCVSFVVWIYGVMSVFVPYHIHEFGLPMGRVMFA